MNPRFKDNIGLCGCGCGLEGVLRVKPWRDGVRCVRTCKCRRCMGRRNRQGGLRKQSAARKALGVGASKFGDANEERWQDAYFANEVKAGQQVGPVANWWRRVEAQVLNNEAEFGDRRRPVRAVAMPADWGKEGLVVVRLSTWETHVRPALEEFYGSGS